MLVYCYYYYCYYVREGLFWRHLYKILIPVGWPKQIACTCVRAPKCVFFFGLEKLIASASSGGVKGSGAADSKGSEACSTEEEARKEMPSVLSLQLYQHQVLAIRQIVPRLTRCQGGNSLCKPLTTNWEIFPSDSLKSVDGPSLSALRKTHTLTTQRFLKGSWQHFDLQKPQTGYEGSEPLALTLGWFIFDHSRNHVIWRKHSLLVSKREIQLAQPTHLQPPTDNGWWATSSSASTAH